MKVVHILNELRHSGAETMLASAAPFLLRAGSATIVSTGADVGSYAPTLQAAGYEIAHIPFRRSPTFFQALYAFLKHRRFDIIHIHPERAAAWYSALAWRSGLPSVRTIHNEFNFTGLLRRRRSIGRRFAEMVGTCHVACSPSVQRNEVARFGIRTELINNWMDPTRTLFPAADLRAGARTRLGLDDGLMVAVSIANEAPAKNLEALFAGVISAARTGARIRLYHCGAAGAGLRAIARDAPEGCIVPLGTVPDIAPYLAAADFFLCTSHNEGGQISLLEAGAAGLTCLTTRVGLAEMLQDQAAVHFIAPTADSLSRQLLRVLSIPEPDRRRDGQQLAMHVRAQFAPERGATEYRRLYERLFYYSEKFSGRGWD